jgi:hypothetical protein
MKKLFWKIRGVVAVVSVLVIIAAFGICAALDFTGRSPAKDEAEALIEAAEKKTDAPEPDDAATPSGSGRQDANVTQMENVTAEEGDIRPSAETPEPVRQGQVPSVVTGSDTGNVGSGAVADAGHATATEVIPSATAKTRNAKP